MSETAESIFNAERMEPIFTAAHSLPRSHVLGFEGEQLGYTHLSGEDAFETVLDELNAHVQARYRAAVEFAGSE